MLQYARSGPDTCCPSLLGKRCCRCTPSICAVGRAALRHNRRGGSKALEPARAGACAPVMVQQHGESVWALALLFNLFGFTRGARSCQPVVHESSATLVRTPGSSNLSRLRPAGTIEVEAAAVAAAIRAHIDGGRPAAEIAVLFRCLSLFGAPVHQPLTAALDRQAAPRCMHVLMHACILQLHSC